MLILAFESSCDETAVAVVEMSPNERHILSSAIASQTQLHAPYGGVVPEIASRAHTEALAPLTQQALEQAEVSLSQIDTIAVTAYPGLIGALLAGVNFAKSLAYANNKPIVAVNHIMGHVASAYLCHQQLKPPFFAAVLSGGHTSIMEVTDYTVHRTISRTRDDAIGEAFDKIGRIIGLPYPGGAAMDKLAAQATEPLNVKFPSAALKDCDDFSFSGLKTAAVNYIHTLTQRGESFDHSSLAASFTNAAVGSIITRLQTLHSSHNYGNLVVAGGVSANSHLRKALAIFGEEKGLNIFLPTLDLCGDNAAMIGAQGYYQAIVGDFSGTDLNGSTG